MAQSSPVFHPKKDARVAGYFHKQEFKTYFGDHKGKTIPATLPLPGHLVRNWTALTKSHSDGLRKLINEMKAAQAESGMYGQIYKLLTKISVQVGQAYVQIPSGNSNGPMQVIIFVRGYESTLVVMAEEGKQKPDVIAFCADLEVATGIIEGQQTAQGTDKDHLSAYFQTLAITLNHLQHEEHECGIPHQYRFISDIFEEDWKVRVALADFDHAIDRDRENDVKNAMGTPMFMAHDLVRTRDARSMSKLGPKALLAYLFDEEEDRLSLFSADHEKNVSWMFNACSFPSSSGSGDVDLQDGWKCEGDPDVESRCPEQDKRLPQHRVMSSKVLTVKARHKMIDKEGPSSTSRDTNHAMGDNLILPVDRPDEMPLDDQTKFHDPTGTFWDIYWWKLRERLWFAADDLY
ncbi:hypothetical protein ACEPAI_9699 [Sanghuangporus weigelae]